MPDQSGHPAIAKRSVSVQPGRLPMLKQGDNVRIAGPAATAGKGRHDIRAAPGHRADGLICAIEAILKVVEGSDTPRHLLHGDGAYEVAMARARAPWPSSRSREKIPGPGRS